MKNMMLSIVFMALVFTAVGLAKEKTKIVTVITENTVESLLNGINSENVGLKTSAVSVSGKIKETKAVIPLMRLLKSSDDERVRIQAAVSLHEIGDARGMYAIQRAIRFDSSERVKRICKLLYWDTTQSSETGF